MKKMITFLLIVGFFSACQREFVTRDDPNSTPKEIADFEAYLDLPFVFYDYTRTLPDYLQSVQLQPLPADNGKATLGRVLFYDKNLSKDRSVSCASCHSQALAFSDKKPVSTGIYGLKGTRNSMALANVASFSAHYREIDGMAPLILWDNRAENVAAQATLAFLNDHEMGMTMDGVVDRIIEQPYYAHLWKQVYGNFDVEADQVLACLSEFVGAIGSTDSRFDQFMQQVNGNIGAMDMDSTISVFDVYSGDSITATITMSTGLGGLSPSELRGKQVFIDNCSKCHSPIRTFQEVFEACNGLDMTYTDQGIGALTGNPTQHGVFKSPSLRNIALTAPYMHDGRFKTMMEVVEFYSTGVQPHPNLHPLLIRNGNAGLAMDIGQKIDLVAFLKTLTDNTVATDERFSNPFKQ